MSDLTANIDRSEMACECGCGFDVADYELLTVVQDSAEFFKHRDRAYKVRILVKSGNRCVSHNESVQLEVNKNYIPLSSKSQHIHAKAIDYAIDTWNGMKWCRVSADDLSTYLDGKYADKYGIGRYWSGRIHLDVRPGKARWVG